MPQQEQQDFSESLEAALSWMRQTQERLRANDNTQGPRDALEARLRETEKIHHSEHEGRVKLELAVVAAEHLLQGGDEELRSHTHIRLKELKSQWEETSTYIIHCHSRIEWVWLHWSEYLKAYEEFELWLTRQQRALTLTLELQLGVKEKLWQVDQQRVQVSDVHSQGALLERLLDEAAALHTRTQDSSVDAQAQERMQRDYNDVRDGAEERLSLLQKIAEEHQTYQGCVQRFQSWLLSKTRELTELMEKDEPAESKLQALRILDDGVAGEEKTLLHIESLSEAVRANTSPAGAEQAAEEAEELRLGWQRLRQGLCEAEEGLRASLDSHRQYMSRCQRLGEDITRLRQLLLSLDQDLEEGRQAGDPAGRSEEQMVGQWRTYTGVKNTLVGEESQVEHLKAQLKDLFRFSEDSRHLSDDVLAVVKEHQSVKCRAARLCSDSESGLRSVLQDPLLLFSQWSLQVSQALEAEVTDFSHIALLVQKIERLLRDSTELQERLKLLQDKGELLDSVFGRERSDTFQTELSSVVRNRELLHSQLLQRKSRLQGLISRTKDFGDAYEQIRDKLAGLRDRLGAADGLQPDILTKKSQSDQFMVILKDLEECEAHITALETLVSSSPSNRTQFERLYSEWKQLYTLVKRKVHDSEENIAEHESFHDGLLNIEKWIMIMKQKLESFHSSSGDWSVEGRQQEAEKALGEFPEKEVQLQRLEAQGRVVLEKTSEDGRVHIQRDMDRLRASWMSLYNTSLNLDRLLRFSTEQTEADSWKLTGLSVGDILAEDSVQLNTGSGRSPAGLKDWSDDMYRTLAFHRPVGSLELELEEEGIIGRSGSWVEGQPPGHFAAAVENKRTPRLSSTRTDSGTSFGGDEMDSPAWILCQKIDQRHAADGNVDGASGIEDLKAGDDGGRSSGGGGGGGVSLGMVSTVGASSEDGSLRYRGGSAEPGDSPSGGRGSGGGGGAGGGGAGGGVSSGARRSLGFVSTVGASSPDGSLRYRGGSAERGDSPSGGRSPGRGGGSAAAAAAAGGGGGGGGGGVSSGARRSLEMVSTVGALSEDGSLRYRGGSSELGDSPSGGRSSGGAVGAGAGGGVEVLSGARASLGFVSTVGASSPDGSLRYRAGSAEPGVSLGHGGGAFVQTFYDGAAQQEMGKSAVTGITQTIGAGTRAHDDTVRGERRSRYRLVWSEFEEWLRKENVVLSDVLSSASSGPLSAQGLKVNQGKIQTLRKNLPHGHKLFQQLRASFDEMDDPELSAEMEELRYQWILYKSKLKDVDLVKAAGAKSQLQSQSKPQKKPGLLYRVCCLALPLWLLLLALLLLAFMLPLAEESSSCSLSNNFARSFNIMLRYQGPPPT